MEETWNAMEERRSRPGYSIARFAFGGISVEGSGVRSTKICDLLLQPNDVVIK